MEVVEVLHMNGGTGDTSYSNNSLLPRKVITITKPIVEQALTELCCSTNFPRALIVADLGCSSGPNTLLVASEIIKTVHSLRLKMGHEPPEIQICLNDLPRNDFNTIFRYLLPEFNENLTNEMERNSSPPRCYFTGMPGSFYTRLFPSKSLHFVHSSYSLMWLSQVPEVVETNKGNIYMSSTSPPSVLRAYYEQFQRDFSVFLKCRSEEMVSQGRMVLTFLGRKSDDPCSKECCYIWELLAMALNDMVSEGLIGEGMMDSFNIPQYTPCPKEVKNEVEKEGSFVIDRLVVSEVNWNASAGKNLKGLKAFDEEDDDVGGYSLAKCMRSVAEPLLVSHFGEGIIEDVFARYRKIISERMSQEKTKFINVTVSLARKG